MIAAGWHRWKGSTNDLDMFDRVLTVGFVSIVIDRRSLERLNLLVRDKQHVEREIEEAEQRVNRLRLHLRGMQARARKESSI